MVNRNEVGRDGVVRVGGSEYPFTNCSFTIEYDTESSDFNDGLRQYTAYINVHVTGSFEWDGSVPAYKDLFLRPDGRPRPTVRMAVDLDEEVLNLEEIKVNSYSREAPADGKTSGTLEWEADVFSFGGQNEDRTDLAIGPGVQQARPEY